MVDHHQGDDTVGHPPSVFRERISNGPARDLELRSSRGGGAVFQVLKAVNPLLNSTPLVKKLAMRVLIVVEPLPE